MMHHCIWAMRRAADYDDTRADWIEMRSGGIAPAESWCVFVAASTEARWGCDHRRK